MDDATVVNEVVSRLLAFLSNLKSEGVDVQRQNTRVERVGLPVRKKSNFFEVCFGMKNVQIVKYSLLVARKPLLSLNANELMCLAFIILCGGRKTGILVKFRSFLAFIERH